MNKEIIHQQLHHRLEDLMEKHEEMMQHSGAIPHEDVLQLLKDFKITYELALSLHHHNAIKTMEDLEVIVAERYNGMITAKQEPAPATTSENRTEHHPANTEELLIDTTNYSKQPSVDLPEGIKMSSDVHDQFEARPTIGQQFKGGATLAEIIAQRSGSSRMSDTLQHAPISDLRTAIGINERFQFIQQLFSGNAGNFMMAVEKINGFSSMNQAMNYLDQEVVSRNTWDLTSEPVRHFVELVERRFNS